MTEDAYGAQPRRQLREAHDQLSVAQRTIEAQQREALKTAALLRQAEGRLTAVRALAADIQHVLDYEGPRHAHQVPGVWDDTGLSCDLCARVQRLRAGLAALDSPAAPEQPACCVCGGGPATYFNYLNLAFCPLCADCQCGQNPCERTGVNDPAVNSVAAAAEPCTGRTGFCRPCRTMHSVPQFGPTVLPEPVQLPSLAAMAQLAERAHAAFLVEQLQLEAAIVTAVEAAGLTIVRSGPVEEVAAHPRTVNRLKTAVLGCFKQPDVPSTPWLPSPVGRLTDLPVIADDSLPAGEVHLRPHPRTIHAPS